MYCKDCGVQLPRNVHTCPNCGAALDSDFRRLQESMRSECILDLPEAVATVLKESPLGIELLMDPKRFLGSVMDAADNESKVLRVLISNCDKEMMREYADAAKVGTLEALEDAATKVSVLLTDHRFIVREVAKQTSRDMALGIEAFLGLRTIDTSSDTTHYDVFVCCKEAEDATGIRTDDGAIAETLSQSLVESGCSVFYPRRSLASRHSSTHLSLVRSALERSRLFVALGVSAEHLSSDWIRRCASMFSRTHSSDSAFLVAYDRMGERDLPTWLASFDSVRIDSENIEVASRIVVRRARELPVGIAKVSSVTPTTYATSDSESNAVHYEVQTLYRSGRKVQAVFLAVLRGFWRVTIRCAKGSGTVRETINAGKLVQDQEAMVLLGTGVTFESIETQPVQAKSTPQDRLVWYPGRFTPGWLTLQLRNTSSVFMGVRSMELVLDDADSTLIHIDANTTLDSYERRTVTVRLSEQEARALGKSKSGRLYLSAPDYRMVRMLE